MLKFDNTWRFDSPGEIPVGVLLEFRGLISKIARGEQKTIEHFKTFFGSVSGTTTSWSSNLSWAETDLQHYMDRASDNAPLFIEAFFDACESLKKNDKELPVPDYRWINRILAKTDAKYKIEIPNLIALDEHNVPTPPPEIPMSLDAQVRNIIQESFSESRRLLAESRYRQAVQEVLWLLETVSTAFQGVSSGENSIQGKYFNKIIDELRRHNQGTALDQIIGWIKNLHGYLSAPSGGGIRHGMDLKEGVATSASDAKLYCNLITSYISYLLLEYERLKSTPINENFDY